MKVGEWYAENGCLLIAASKDCYLEHFQVVAQAPTSWSASYAIREFDGRDIRGSYSDPWWLYSPDNGWALARRWKNPPVGKTWRSINTCWPPIPRRDLITIDRVDMREIMMNGATPPVQFDESENAS